MARYKTRPLSDIGVSRGAGFYQNLENAPVAKSTVHRLGETPPEIRTENSRFTYLLAHDALVRQKLRFGILRRWR